MNGAGNRIKITERDKKNTLILLQSDNEDDHEEYDNQTEDPFKKVVESSKLKVFNHNPIMNEITQKKERREFVPPVALRRFNSNYGAPAGWKAAQDLLPKTREPRVIKLQRPINPSLSGKKRVRQPQINGMSLSEIVKKSREEMGRRTKK